MKSQSLYPRPFALLTLAFVLFTILGTLTHEMGHIAVAKYYGYETELHYASMNYDSPERQEFWERYEQDKEYIDSPEDSPQKQAFHKYREQMEEKVKGKAFSITMGGPIQTMLTGSIGVLILWFRRKKIFAKKFLNAGEWLAVLLAYFWARQVFNFMVPIPEIFQDIENNHRGDEPRISHYLGLPHWGFGLITCTIGAALLLWVTFRVVPKKQRFTFIISGLAGCALGWFVWMHWLGPQLMP